MGLTPLEGLVMGTRSGDIDPAIIFFLADKGHDLNEINDICNKQSGLLGVSETSNDMRTLTQQAAEGNQRARLAIDIFCYRVKKYLGAYAAVLGRLDAVVFTGGIGENSPAVRAACCDQLQQLGIEMDPVRNEQTIGAEGEIQATASRVRLLVIPTDEEGVIAADTFELTRAAF
jgi:acetate kinase